MEPRFIGQPELGTNPWLERIHDFCSKANAPSRITGDVGNNSTMAILDPVSGDVLGVSCTIKMHVPHLGNRSFYELSCFFHNCDLSHGWELLFLSKTILALRVRNEILKENCLGILYVLRDSNKLNEEYWCKANWPELNMTLLGFTKTGQPIFVHYFPFARL